jgi:hypothetical protein
MDRRAGRRSGIRGGSGWHRAEGDGAGDRQLGPPATQLRFSGDSCTASAHEGPEFIGRRDRMPDCDAVRLPTASIDRSTEVPMRAIALACHPRTRCSGARRIVQRWSDNGSALVAADRIVAPTLDRSSGGVSSTCRSDTAPHNRRAGMTRTRRKSAELIARRRSRGQRCGGGAPAANRISGASAPDADAHAPQKPSTAGVRAQLRSSSRRRRPDWR